MKKIGLLGCGAIGTQIALAMDSGKIPATLTHVYDQSKEASELLVSKLKNKPQIVENFHKYLAMNLNPWACQPLQLILIKSVGKSWFQNCK